MSQPVRPWASRPSAEYRYWLYDPEDGIHFYRTAEDRDADARGAIQLYLGDDWNEDVTGVCGGEVHLMAQQVDRQEKPTDDQEAIAEWNNLYGEAGYLCNYVLRPLAPSATTEESGVVTHPAGDYRGAAGIIDLRGELPEEAIRRIRGKQHNPEEGK